jgi:hypothetical protein
MKYIITESKLNSAIYEFIDQAFASKDGNTEIYKLPTLDEEGEEIIEAYDFVNDDYYSDSGVDDYLFAWTGEEYYKLLLKDGHVGKYEYERLALQSPLVDIYDKDILNKLNGYFGDTWKPVFKEWFRHKTGMDFKSLYEVSY